MKVTAFQPYLTVFLCVCTETRNCFIVPPDQMMRSANARPRKRKKSPAGRRVRGGGGKVRF